MLTSDRTINILDRVIEYSIYAIVIALPFSKAVLEVSVTLLIFAWLVKKVIAKEGLNIPKPLFIIAFIFFVCNAISILNSDFLGQSVRALFTKMGQYIFLMFAVSDSIRQRRVVRNVVKIFFVVAFIVALDGLAQYFFRKDLIRFKDVDRFYYYSTYDRATGKYTDTRRVSACLPAANVLASYLLVSIMLVIGFVFSKKKESLVKLAISVLSLIVIVGCFVLTFSRGAYIAFLLCIIWFAFYRSGKILLILLPIVALLAFFPMRSYLNRAPSTVKFDPTIHKRIVMWEGAVNMVKEHPIIGNGLNTFNANYLKYKSPQIDGNPYAHNSYLQMLSEIGVIGLAAFMGLLLCLNRIWKRQVKLFEDDEMKSLSYGVMAAISGLCIHAFFDNVFFAMTPAVALWFLLGYNLAVGRLVASGGEQR